KAGPCPPYDSQPGGPPSSIFAFEGEAELAAAVFAGFAAGLEVVGEVEVDGNAAVAGVGAGFYPQADAVVDAAAGADRDVAAAVLADVEVVEAGRLADAGEDAVALDDARQRRRRVEKLRRLQR